MLRIAKWTVVALATMVAAVLSTSSAHASTIDATNDFLGTYTGPKIAELDVTSVDATFNGSTFVLSATMAGNISPTGGSRYVWGANRGGGTAGFASIGATNVLFNAVIVLNANGTGTANGNPLQPGDIVISGASITARIKAAFLPSTGFALTAYTFNLWPRSPGTGNGVISDFAPDNANIAATLVPEPTTLASAGLAALASLAMVRRRIRAR